MNSIWEKWIWYVGQKGHILKANSIGFALFNFLMCSSLNISSYRGQSLLSSDILEGDYSSWQTQYIPYTKQDNSWKLFSFVEVFSYVESFFTHGDTRNAKHGSIVHKNTSNTITMLQSTKVKKKSFLKVNYKLIYLKLLFRITRQCIKSLFPKPFTVLHRIFGGKQEVTCSLTNSTSYL